LLWSTELSAYRAFFPGIVTVYLLFIVHLLEHTREGVARSLRPHVKLDDESFAAAVTSACRSKPIWELIGAAIGIIVLVSVVGRPGRRDQYYLADLYFYFSTVIMFAAIGWCVYAVALITRLTNSLLKQPIEFDIFDVTPFEPIGTQSLYLSLALVGTLLIGLLASPYPLTSWQNVLLASGLVLISVLIFFINMIPTHRLLASTKKREITLVDRKIAQGYRGLLQLESQQQDLQPISAEFIAWATAKQQLNAARTWPYNTEMLRTLFVTVLIPVVVALARIVGPLLGWSF
jgi:hypothetical protein